MRHRRGPAATIVLTFASVIFLSACGVPESADTTIQRADDEMASGLKPPRPIALLGGLIVMEGPLDAADIPDSGGESSGASVDGSAEAASDSVVVSQFQLGDVGAMPTESTAYRFDQPVSVVEDESVIRRIADAVNMGDALKHDDPVETGLVWSAGDPGSDGAWFSVSATAPFQWSYAAAASTLIDSASDVAAADTTGAEQAARDLVKSIGVDPETLRWKSIQGALEAGRPIALVSAVPHTIPIAASESASPYLGYEFMYDTSDYDTSENGSTRMVWAQGPLGEPSALGPYPLIDATTAIERLNSNSGQWFMYAPNASGAPDPDGWPSIPATPPQPVTSTGVASGPLPTVPMLTTTASSVPTMLPHVVTTTAVASRPLPTAPMLTTTVPLQDPHTPPDASPVTTAASNAVRAASPEVETKLVTLTDPVPDLIAVEAAEGTWLLPAYRFTGDDGQWHSVLAVADDFVTIQGPPQPSVTTFPPTTMVPTTILAVGEVQVPGALVDAMGLPLSEFEAAAAEAGFTVRVVVLDGIEQPREDDLRTDRVNIFVDTRAGNSNDPTVVGIEGIS